MFTIYVSGYFTLAQIQSKIDSISSAIDVILSGGKSYRLNDGQGDIQVTRESLSTLQTALDYWVDKYNELTDDDAALISVEVTRREIH